MTSIAVLGTGIMGAPIARNLARAGFDVHAWNRTIEKAEPLADEGVRICRSVSDAVEPAELLLTILADVDAVAHTVDGRLREGLVWLQCSTVGISGTDRLSRLAADAGTTFVDAPVLGTRLPAEKGQLTVLASGPGAARDRCQPVLDVIGARTIWLGEEPGAASRLKLVMNSWVLAITSATAEAMALADGLGLDPKRFLDTIEGGPMDVTYAHLKGGAMIRREFPASFPAWGAAKDAGLILEAAGIAGVNLAVAAAVREQMQATVDTGHGEEDLAAVWWTVRDEQP